MNLLENKRFTTSPDKEELSGFARQRENQSIQKANGRRVRAFCNAINMPDREIVMKEVKHNGPARKYSI